MGSLVSKTSSGSTGSTASRLSRRYSVAVRPNSQPAQASSWPCCTRHSPHVTNRTAAGLATFVTVPVPTADSSKTFRERPLNKHGGGPDFSLGRNIFFATHWSREIFFQGYMEPTFFFFTNSTIVTFRQLSRTFFFSGIGTSFFWGGGHPGPGNFFQKNPSRPAYLMVAPLRPCMCFVHHSPCYMTPAVLISPAQWVRPNFADAFKLCPTAWLAAARPRGIHIPQIDWLQHRFRRMTENCEY